MAEISRTIESTLSFVQEISYSGEYTRDVESSIEFEQQILNPNGESVQSDLLFIQEITAYIERPVLDQVVIHDLNFTQEISHAGEFNREVEHQLDFDQTVASSGVHERTVIHKLAIRQDISSTQNHENVQAVEHVLSFGQTISTGGDFNQSVESVLSFSQVISVTVNDVAVTDACVRPDLTYVTGQAFPTAPSLTDTQFKIDYPPTSPTLTINLPDPLLGNREELMSQRIQRQTRGGTPIAFRDDSWPKHYTYNWEFFDVDETKRDEFFTFLTTSMGLQVRVTTHEGLVYDGVIVNPTIPSEETHRDCGYTIGFQFEGVEVT
jgi:hypothetical protein